MGKICPLGIALLVLPAFAQTSSLEHGKYLVNNVAMCGDCHTPRLPNGQPDQARLLKGGRLDFMPVQPVPNWSKYAPDITAAGIAWSESEMASYLETGRDPGGRVASPPMPAFKMNRQDAEAVARYLKSLKPLGPAKSN
jgi:mono/diheme cytochrome c family protein